VSAPTTVFSSRVNAAAIQDNRSINNRRVPPNDVYLGLDSVFARCDSTGMAASSWYIRVIQMMWEHGAKRENVRCNRGAQAAQDAAARMVASRMTV
jgi:hypothetical protein